MRLAVAQLQFAMGAHFVNSRRSRLCRQVDRGEAFLLQIILNQRKGWSVPPMRCLLFFLMRVFNVMVRVRQFVK